MIQNSGFHLAQINIGRIIGTTIHDPIMEGFVSQLEEVNTLAETSKGFVWRLKDENNNATSLNPYNDDQIIINMSVWETLEDLEAFVYYGRHVQVLKDRRKWFVKFGSVFMVLWYIPIGHIPSIEEARERMDHLHQNGPTQMAFDFKVKFAPPAHNF